ncbi:hypothetical protein GE061_003934 [Apolygus lucorum]|uniref:Uncharacterized protein n=1 Tax=Apolygus lucorum TaxID=248454 RepID=A0A8S9WXY3_APOLU|nr:hypothetical protein GE061_003934 [Apolygus lucorum]
MEDDIVVKGEPMSEGEGTETDQVTFEVVMIKQEVMIEDEHVEEDVGGCRRVEDEVGGYPIIKQQHESTADPLGDECDVLEESVEMQTTGSEAGPSTSRSGVPKKHLMTHAGNDQIRDEHVEEEVGNTRRVEDEVAGQMIVKQETSIEDENVQEVVGNTRGVEDEDAGYPIIKQQHESTADPLGDECDGLEESIGVQGCAEEGPSAEASRSGVLKKHLMTHGGNDQIRDEHVEEEVGNTRRVEDEVAGHLIVKQETSIEDENVQEVVGNTRRVEDEVAGHLIVKQETSIEDENVQEVVGNTRGVEDEDAGHPIIKQQRESTADPLGDESDNEHVEEGVGNTRRVEDEVGGCPAIKQEVLIRDEHVEEEDGNSRGFEDKDAGCLMNKQDVPNSDERVKEDVGGCRRVEDELEGYPMTKKDHESTTDPLVEESDVLQGSVEKQDRLVRNKNVEGEVENSRRVEDEVPKMKYPMINQKVLIGDEPVVVDGNRGRVEDEVVVYPMIEQEVLTGDEPVVEDGNRGRVADEVVTYPLIKQGVLCGDEPVEEDGNTGRVEDEVVVYPVIKQEVLFGDEPVEEDENSRSVEDEVVAYPLIKQEMLFGDEPVEEDGNTGRVEDEVVEYPMINQEVLNREPVEEGGNIGRVKDAVAAFKHEPTADPLGDESDVLQGSVEVQTLSEAGPSRESPALAYHTSTLDIVASETFKHLEDH